MTALFQGGLLAMTLLTLALLALALLPALALLALGALLERAEPLHLARAALRLLAVSAGIGFFALWSSELFLRRRPSDARV